MMDREYCEGLTQEDLNDEFLYYCNAGRLQEMKYLLASPELEVHADIHVDDDYAFRGACRNGNLEIVKYLLTSPELKEHANIHAADDEGFVWAAGGGHVEVVRYLLTSPELKERSDIHADNDGAFKVARIFNNWEMIKFLIFEMKLDMTEEIDRILMSKYDKEIRNWFSVRDLNDKLNNDLEVDPNEKNRMKL